MNVILNAARTQASLKGATLYVFGLPVCSNCAKGIVQSGISRVVIPYYTEIPERWTEEWELTTALFEECGIEIIFVDFK
jgi:dCMP deaminase